MPLCELDGDLRQSREAAGDNILDGLDDQARAAVASGFRLRAIE
jgi:hypothetical protein